MEKAEKEIIRTFFEEIGKDIEGGCDMSNDATELIKRLEEVQEG